jgi:YVTN family beta-propeller protein
MRLAIGTVCLTAAALLLSCGGGENDDAAANVRERAKDVTPPASFFPNVTIPTDAHARGMWSPLYAWPGVAVHAVLLPDARVLTYGSTPSGLQGGGSSYDIWDGTVAPDVGHMTLPNGTGTDIFCSSNVLLPSESPGSPASVFIAGGNGTENGVNRNSVVLDVATGTLTRRSDMQRARWYATSTTLINGEVYIQGGINGTDRPEVRSLAGNLRLLSAANTSAFDFYYPRNFVAPDGRVFGFESNGQMYYVDTAGNGSIALAGQFSSQYAGASGSATMFRPGRILQVGGYSSAAQVIDITGTAPVLTPTQSVSSQRQWVTTTLLADGRVLATGGSQNDTTDGNNGPINANRTAEIWNPTTGQWLQGPAGARDRLYHSNAILLRDGSVLVAGGGALNPPEGWPSQLNAEIYYPPYFFAAGGQRAQRPIIASAPDWVEIGSVLPVSVANAASVSRVTLVKTSATTHSFNMDQRFLELTYVANGLNLSVQAPTRAADAPPGYYMLFVFNEAGVPSIAKIVRMGIAPVPNPATVPSIANPGTQNGGVGSAVTLALSASDPNGDTLTFSAAGLPPGLTFDTSTGAIAGTPSTEGEYNVVVSVSDGINVASASFLWRVNPVNGVVIDPLVPVVPTQMGTQTTFTASTQGGSNPLYRWNFGDGTGDTPWSVSPSASHTFTSPGAFVVTFSATDDSQIVRTRTMLHTVYLSPTANKPAVSSNIVVQTPANGNPRLWVVNQDNNSVSVFDAVTSVKQAEIMVGADPRSIAVAANGLVWVSNKRSDSISVIDPASNGVIDTIALPRASRPFGIAMSPTAAQAFVVLEATGQLLKIDSATRTLLGSTSVGANPRQLSITAEGAYVYVSRFITPPLPGEAGATVTPTATTGAEVIQIAADTLSQVRTIVLRHGDKVDAENQGRGVPNYLGAAAISPDGTQAWIPSKQDNVKRGALRDGSALNFQNTVRAVSSRIVLATGQEDLSRRIDHDNASVASAAAYD